MHGVGGVILILQDPNCEAPQLTPVTAIKLVEGTGGAGNMLAKQVLVTLLGDLHAGRLDEG